MQNTDVTTPEARSGCRSLVSTVRVLIDHQDPLLARGMEATLFRADDGFEVVRHERETLPSPHQPGTIPPHSPRVFYPAAVLVADYDTGLRHANDARLRGSILIVTQFEDAARIRLAVQHGIRGYLLQGCSAEDLIQGVLALHRGATALAPIVTARIAEIASNESLTDRQLTVLRYLMLGLSTKEICRHMTIADGTVKAHVRAIFAKLGANSRAQAVAIARRQGLLLETIMPEVRREWLNDGVPHSATRMTGTGY
jgi:DNA-binding NarL/FixJ family response regulator